MTRNRNDVNAHTIVVRQLDKSMSMCMSLSRIYHDVVALSFCIYTIGLSSQVAIHSYFMCYDALLNLDGSSILNCQKCCLSFYRSSLCQTTPCPDVGGLRKSLNIT